jgi:hypothetical protein
MKNSQFLTSTELKERWQIKEIDLFAMVKEKVINCLDEEGFCLQYYGQPFKVRSHLMRWLCEKAGVKPFGFHAIRHLSATVLYHNGKSLHYLQRFLRHKNPMTTQRYLQKLGLEPLRDGLEKGFRRPDTGQPDTPPPKSEPGGSSGTLIQFPKKNPPGNQISVRVSAGVQPGVQAPCEGPLPVTI